jgi:tetratricopeptide (TPR) repeat protein
MTNGQQASGEQRGVLSGLTSRKRDEFLHSKLLFPWAAGAKSSALATTICFTLIFLSQAWPALGGVSAALVSPALSQVTSSDGRRFGEIDKLIESGDLRGAREILTEEVAARGESYQTLFREAKILFREQKYRESMKVLERALSLNQRDAELYKLVASNAILLSRMDIAEQALKNAVPLAPNDYLVFFHLGALYYTDSRFPSAQPVLEKSVELNPDYVPARLFLGLTLEELGQEQSAVDCYLRAIEIAERAGQKGEQPYLYLGRLLYRENKMAESFPYLQKAVKANPQSCESLCLLARIHSSQGQESDAVAALSQCIRGDPKYSEAHYLLSRAYVKQGRTGEAAKELSQFQELKKLEKNSRDPRKNQRANP